ncbi:MAG: histidine--tRNA ligase [Betaproteobacteria bacterium]
MIETIQSIKGMNDVLPDEAPLWEFFEETVRRWLRAYGYRQMRMPVLERTELFVRSIGEVTDIVEKEMFTFTDRLNGDVLTLRPEGTASCVRAAIQHNLLYGGAQRVWYAGPMFRHERPQKGRYRQFHQVGVEALGLGGAETDAELIVMGARLWRLLGLGGIELQINTLGDTDARARYRARLVGYLEQRQDELDDDARRRMHSNPLRVLDSKNPGMQALIEAAPRLLDDLDEESLRHFESLQRLLRHSGVEYRINSRLVRGLDYYNRTVFEWVTTELGAQGTVCAGGRYDGLVEQIGGKSAPAAGFAMGVERLIALLAAGGGDFDKPVPDVFLAWSGEHADLHAWRTAEWLRDRDFSVTMNAGGGSFKAQMKRADASGARFAIIIGDDEAALGSVTLKPLRDQCEQVRVALEDVAPLLAIPDSGGR